MNTTHRIYSLDIIRRQTAPLPWIAILAIMMVRAALGQCVPPPNDLISWWQAEGNADDFVDGNHGLLVHGATFAPGLVHQAFSFDGVDDHVSINDAPNLRPAAFTLVAWIRTTDASFQQPIIAKAQAAGNWVSYMLRIRDGGRLELAVENRSEFRYAHWLSDATLSADTWYHLVGTWANVNGDLTDGRIYINGAEVSSTTQSLNYSSTFTPGYTTLPLFISRDEQPSGQFVGLIDEVAIFNRALTSSEVESLFQAGNAGMCTTPSDATPPVLGCPADLQANADSDACSASSVDLGTPAVTDDSGVASVVNDAPAQFPVGTTLVTWTATDGAGNEATCQQQVTVVDDQPPQVICPPDVLVEADPGQCEATGVDLGTPLGADNCGIFSVGNDALGSFPVGTTLVTWTVLDVHGLSATCAQYVTVTSSSCGAGDPQPPVVAITDAPSDPVNILNQPVLVGGAFTDPNEGDLHTALWDWGDGTMSEGTVVEDGGTGVVVGSHVYEVPGVYRLRLVVMDDDGATADDEFEYVVIYDPSGGFVTGGGWIASPAGAFHPGLEEFAGVTGKANFGFVAKYKKGAHIPTGQTQFQFKAGDLNFHSTSYEWLVVAGAKAKFKGNGTINGVPDFGFMLTATDGQVAGGGGVDRFRIKIWQEDNGAVIYDNQPGDSDDGDATTALGGGSIVIHKR